MKDFKRFAISTILVLLIVFIIDLLLGFFCNKELAQYGDMNFYEASHNKAEVAVIGASVTVNQYDSRVMADSLGLNVYNYGAGGQNIYYHYSVVHYLLDKAEKKPQIIVYNPCHIDLCDADGWNTENLNALYFAYNNDEEVRKAVDHQDVKHRTLLHISKLYPNNSQLVNYIKNALFNKVDNNNGYAPLNAVWDKPIEKSEGADGALDPEKVKYFKSMVSLCKERGVLFIITIAPMYFDFAREDAWRTFIKQYAMEENIPLYDYRSSEKYLQHPEWFYNPLHLNAQGASIYSGEISHILKQEISDVK